MPKSQSTSHIHVEYQQKIVGVLSVLFPTAKIYLFGSQARGTATRASDIDIAIDEGARILPIGRIAEARDMLNASNLPYKIEVVDLHAISTLMKEQVEKDGILWKT